MAHVLESAALALQANAGCPVTFSRTAATMEDGVFQTVVEYSEEAVGRLALELAQALVHAALNETGFDLDSALAQLSELDEDERLGPSTGAIVDAAVARGIPYKRLTKGSLVQFGWGSRQRRIQAAELDATSAVSESIAQDKDLTKRLLLAAMIPLLLASTACGKKVLAVAVKPPPELLTCADEPETPDIGVPGIERDRIVLAYLLAMRGAFGDCASKVAGIKSWADALP